MMEIILFLLLLVVVCIVTVYHTVVFSGVLVVLAFPLPLWHFIRSHPFQTVGYTAGYFLIGAAWSVAKWWFRETDLVRKAREDFNKALTKDTWEGFAKWRKTNVDACTEDILIWIAFWPFSAIFTLLDDPIRRVCRRIYQELKGVYQRITDYVWRG